MAELEREADEEREKRLASNSRGREREGARPVSDRRFAEERDGEERDGEERRAPRELPTDIAAQDDVARMDERETTEDVDYRRPTGSGLRRPASLGAPAASGRGRRFRYDAEGILKRVQSERRIAPPYALVDDEGEIVALVKPSPGLNLQSYLGRKVGMYGTQRTLPSFRKTLLTAERVVRMDRVR